MAQDQRWELIQTYTCATNSPWIPYKQHIIFVSLPSLGRLSSLPTSKQQQQQQQQQQQWQQATSSNQSAAAASSSSQQQPQVAASSSSSQ